MDKFAIIHYYLISIRGGERVFHTLAQAYPDANLFSVVYNPDSQPEWLRSKNIATSFVQNIPGSWKYYRQFFSFYPLGVESFDLRGYNVVISSAAGWTLGALTHPGTMHVCYCHTPLRYVWNWYHQFLANTAAPIRPLMRVLLNWVRIWDYNAAQRVDYFIANSSVTQQRIKKYYGRDSVIINPPIDTTKFKPLAEIGDYYLVVSELVPYKKVDLVIEAFNRSGKFLKIVGDGVEANKLRQMAAPNIMFLGRASDDVLADAYARCKALVFMPEEDFGMVPLEAQASGRPVIAYGAAGALETVIAGQTGIFFEHQTVDDLLDAIERFEQMSFNSDLVRKHACSFDTTVFQDRIKDFVSAKYADFKLKNQQPPIYWN